MPKTVVITGGSRGIGRACAERFAAAGYAVALCCRSRIAEAEAVAADLRAKGYPAFAMQADVTEEAAVAAFFAETLRRFGRIDVLVNNAGIARFGLLGDLSVEEWDTMMNTTLRGAFLCCRAAIPPMLRQEGGCIVNISSIWGITGASCEVAYSAAKAGLIGMTKALAKELGPSQIRVNCVAPGVIDTEMNAMLQPEDLQALCEETPLGRIGTPQEVADAVFFLAEGQSSFITGQVLGVGGGIVI